MTAQGWIGGKPVQGRNKKAQLTCPD
ncbi:hypothetical protein OK016_26730 [Vibrio chagasii]|nr:hypothetical protein [Vibrio chagasii]